MYGAAFGIFVGGEVALGLVEEEVDLGGVLDGLAVEGDAVADEVHPVIGGLDQLAVHANSAGADPLAGFGARAQAGFRQDAL